MLDANPESIVHYPLIPMAQFNRTLGEIPTEFGGGNRYRIIWAPTRNILRFTRGISEVVSAYGRNGIEPVSQQLSPAHKAGECWVLEQWVNPYRDCPEEEWNTKPAITVANEGFFTRLQVMGPFPRRGYYWRCDNTYLHGEPTLSQVEREILLVEDGFFRHTQWENYVAIRDRIAAGEKKIENRNQAMIRDRFLIGGGEAWSSSHGHRGTKTVNTNLDTRHLRRRGFSTKPGTVSATPRGKKVVYDLTPHVQL